MLGKSAGYAALGALVLFGCARTIAQDAKSSEDGKVKGAKPMVMDNGEARASGIVTYPGGDRVDWKLIETPDKKLGTLDFKLTWNPPRPGLQLAFDVFDEWNNVVAGSKKTSKKRAAGKIRTASLSNARGKYFVRVYAVGRGDAGKYRLSAEFRETTPGLTFDPLKLEIADPPKLAAVPDIEQGCDEFTFDVKIPACKMVCPAANAPPNWPACKGRCPTPPTVDEPACWPTMPCPKGSPDERVKACKPKDWPPCPDKNQPDESNPNCRIKAAPVVGRILGTDIQGSELLVRVGVGAQQGVKKDTWTAAVIRSGNVNDALVPGGSGTIIRVDPTVTIVKIRLTPDQVNQTPFVRLAPL
jgi:hypothetical protein